MVLSKRTNDNDLQRVEINKCKIGTLLGYVVVFSIHIHYSFSYEARLCFAGLDRVHIALSC